MVHTTTTNTSDEQISVPITVGDRVTLLTDIDSDSSDGWVATPVFEDTVVQYVPETGLLRFEDSDIGRAEFLERLADADGVQVI